MSCCYARRPNVDEKRPRLWVEKLWDKEITDAEIPKFVTNGHEHRWPHCDARILHAVGECEYCDMAKDLQSERETLDVSNTGKTNRRWPCPADLARKPEQYNAWSGNRPENAEAKVARNRWLQELERLAGEVDGDG